MNEKNRKKKYFSMGSYSILTSVTATAIAVIVVMLIQLLPANITKYDTTKSRFFTLSGQTENVLNSLDENINLYLIAKKGGEDSYITKLLEKYETASDKINVEYKDPVLYPSFASQYTDQNVGENSIIVTAGEKSKLISINDIYSTDYTNGSELFNGESLITGAISVLTGNTSYTVYQVSGHREGDISAGIESELKNRGYNLKYINLNTADKIPDDCACLLIYSPKSDFTADETDKVINYLNNKGSVFYVSDYLEEKTENLDRLVDIYGLKKSDGAVFEGDSNHCLSNYRHYILPDMQDSEITGPLEAVGYELVMPMMQSIRQLEKLPEGVVLTELLSSSDKSYEKRDIRNLKTMEKEDGDRTGPFTLAVTAQKNGGSMVWVTSSWGFEDKYSQMSAGANDSFFINCMSWAAGDKNGISVAAKPLGSTSLKISARAGTVLTAVFVGVIPLAVIICAIVVIVRRKRR